MSDKKWLRKLEKSYLYIILLLPLAAIMLRLSSYAPLSWLGVYGQVIYGNLPLFYAMAIVYAFSKRHRGIGMFSVVVFYLIFKATYIEVNPENDLNILGGIVSGLTVTLINNKLDHFKFKNTLEILSDQRHIPIISSLLSGIMGLAFGFIWPVFSKVITSIGYWIASSSHIGTFLYGFLNRLLLPFGLHHHLNDYLWHEFGNFNGVTGDMDRFMAGDLSAGTYMSGFYIIMMFGLPAIILAFYTKASKESRHSLRGLYLVSILISILTGITEPIELLFLFLLPKLYLLHSFFTGLALVSADLLKIKIGFNFSAGLLDLIQYASYRDGNFRLIWLGFIFALLYYLGTLWIMHKSSMTVPGDRVETEANQKKLAKTFVDDLTQKLGGFNNIRFVNIKFTRFEIELIDEKLVTLSDTTLNERNQLIRVGNKTYQLITGNQGKYLKEAFIERFNEKVV